MIAKLLGIAGILALLMAILSQVPPATEVKPLFPEMWVGIGFLVAIAACLVSAAVIGVWRGISRLGRQRRSQKAIDRVMEANHPLPSPMDRWRP